MGMGIEGFVEGGLLILGLLWEGEGERGEDGDGGMREVGGEGGDGGRREVGVGMGL